MLKVCTTASLSEDAAIHASNGSEFGQLLKSAEFLVEFCAGTVVITVIRGRIGCKESLLLRVSYPCALLK